MNKIFPSNIQSVFTVVLFLFFSQNILAQGILNFKKKSDEVVENYDYQIVINEFESTIDNNEQPVYVSLAYPSISINSSNVDILNLGNTINKEVMQIVEGLIGTKMQVINVDSTKDSVQLKTTIYQNDDQLVSFSIVVNEKYDGLNELQTRYSFNYEIENTKTVELKDILKKDTESFDKLKTILSKKMASNIAVAKNDKCKISDLQFLNNFSLKENKIHFFIEKEWLKECGKIELTLNTNELLEILDRNHFWVIKNI